MPDRPRLPVPPERPRFDAATDDDGFLNDDESRAGSGPPRRPRDFDDGGGEDAGLFRMLGALVLVAAVVVALVLPASPVRVIGRGGSEQSAGQGVSARSRSDLPALPRGLTAVSRLYDLSVPNGLGGTQMIEIALNGHVDDGKNLAFYAYEDTTWKRLAPATLTSDGKSAFGELPYPPRSVAVLRSTATARSLGLIVSAGQVPEARALTGSSVVAVRGGVLGKDAKAVTLYEGGLAPAVKAANGKPVYLLVEAGAEFGGGSPLGGDLAASMVATAKASGASGVLIDLGSLPNAQREGVSRFSADLSARLRAERLGFLIAVPAAGRDGGAYDWKALLGVADGLWLMPRVDAAMYYSDVNATLDGARDAGVDLARVALVLDRRSQETVPGQRSMLSRKDALSLASAIQRSADSGIGGSVTVSLSAPFLAGSGGGLHWDEVAKAVGFLFTEGGKPHAVWVENRFSAAFRLDLANGAGLGGVVVDQAEADETLADVFEAATAFAQGASLKLERPFGPYLVPCWEALGGGAIEGASACWEQSRPAPSAVWRAPKTGGVYTVRLVVSDGVVFIGQELSLRVSASGLAEPGGGLTATPTAPNAAPATPGQPTPRPAGGPPPGPAGN
jgi:hypothetical protein